jgi:hypothetical protein
MLIRLTERLFVNPEFVVAVATSGLDDDECSLFTTGQSAIDGGYSIPYSAEDVAEQVNDGCAIAQGLDESEGEEGDAEEPEPDEEEEVSEDAP